MNKWLAVILIIGIITFVILVQMGVVNVSWAKLGIIGAALLGPFKFILSFFGDKEKEIKEKFEAIRRHEATYQDNLERSTQAHAGRIARAQQQVGSIDRDIGVIDTDISAIDHELKLIDQQRELIRSKRYSLEEMRLEVQRRAGKR